MFVCQKNLPQKNLPQKTLPRKTLPQKNPHFSFKVMYNAKPAAGKRQKKGQKIFRLALGVVF
jgi:hypothetical protein